MSTSYQRRLSSAYSLFPSCAPDTNTSRNTVKDIPVWYVPSVSDGKTEYILGKPELDISERLPPTESKRQINDYFPVLRAINRIKRHSANMRELIPLKLTAISSPFSKPTPPTRNVSSPTPSYASEQPFVPARRSSVRRSRPVHITDLNILPYTREDWRKITEEVRTLFDKGKYKDCSILCSQVINGIKDPYRVHPLHITTLSFFAASSLEITASSLHHNSAARLPLYREALTFYQKAEDSLEYASFGTDPSDISSLDLQAGVTHQAGGPNRYQMAHHPSDSSVSSANSVFSATDSIFSHRSSSSCSMNSVIFTSPIERDSNAHLNPRCNSALSTHSLPESSRSSPQMRHKKKVTFVFSPTLPTLPSENDVPATAPDASILINSFPTPPFSPTPPDSPTLPSLPSISDQTHQRYKSHLSDLSQQLAYHIAVLQESIAHTSAAPAPLRSNSLDFSVSLLFDEIDAPSHPSLRLDIKSGDEQSEECQILDIQARIKKLRANGWQKKRFNPTRYKYLCERALYEVVED